MPPQKYPPIHLVNNLHNPTPSNSHAEQPDRKCTTPQHHPHKRRGNRPQTPLNQKQKNHHIIPNPKTVNPSNWF